MVATTDHLHNVPVRMCCGCRERRPQHDLVRCADGPHGIVVHRLAPGRGAWVCSTVCADLAVRKGGFARAFRRPITPDEGNQLRLQLNTVFATAADM